MSSRFPKSMAIALERIGGSHYSGTWQEIAVAHVNDARKALGWTATNGDGE